MYALYFVKLQYSKNLDIMTIFSLIVVQNLTWHNFRFLFLRSFVLIVKLWRRPHFNSTEAILISLFWVSHIKWAAQRALPAMHSQTLHYWLKIGTLFNHCFLYSLNENYMYLNGQIKFRWNSHHFHDFISFNHLKN